VKILPGRLYQCDLSSGDAMWDSPIGESTGGSIVHWLKGGDVVLVVDSAYCGDGQDLPGNWWLQVLCNGVRGYVRTGRVQGNLTEVKQ